MAKSNGPPKIKFQRGQPIPFGKAAKRFAEITQIILDTNAEEIKVGFKRKKAVKRAAFERGSLLSGRAVTRGLGSPSILGR